MEHSSEPLLDQGKLRPKSRHETKPPPANGEMPPPLSEPIDGPKLSRFRIDNAAYAPTTTEALTTVLIARPDPDEFIRVHPGDDMRLTTVVFKQFRDYYLIDPPVMDLLRAKVEDIARHISTAMLRPYIARESAQISLWPLKMESPYSVGGNVWNVSAFSVAKRCEVEWLRVSQSPNKNMYIGLRAEGPPFPDPVWPEFTIDQLVDMASRINIIDSIDHPLIRKLRGLPPG